MMSISQSLLPEFDQEMASTRKVLERIPEEKFTWKPHEKSYTLLKLATHVGMLPTWLGMTLNTSRLDLSQPFTPPSPSNRADILSLFDRNVTEARAALAGATDQVMFASWTLANGPHEIFTLPKVAVIRSFVLNHLIHHRAQLTVYLRLNNVPVPGMYGPSADESGM
jgi:uncharacterized damage-inducible protein DinB